MRLWTLHPKYLDTLGLVALWRETLLAQAVLMEQTRGYRHHPQLLRFRETQSPQAAIGVYLRGIRAEATRRGYRFDATKIACAAGAEYIVATSGQLDYEWSHLKDKLRIRSPLWLAAIQDIVRPESHPLFKLVPGEIADWEA